MQYLQCADYPKCDGRVPVNEKRLHREPNGGPFVTAHLCKTCGLLHQIVLEGGSRIAIALKERETGNSVYLK